MQLNAFLIVKVMENTAAFSSGLKMQCYGDNEKKPFVQKKSSL